MTSNPAARTCCAPPPSPMARKAVLRHGALRSTRCFAAIKRSSTVPMTFRTLVLPVGSGQTLMRPPIVSAAQMAFALGDGGQIARETSCIYQITREAQLASTPPNWRAYLVRAWATPRRPTDGALPRTRQEAAYWNKWVAEGLGGRARSKPSRFSSPISAAWNATSSAWRVIGSCCAPGWSSRPLAFQNRTVEGGRDSLHVGDKTIRITDQPGLQGNPRRWAPSAGCPQ